MVSTTDLPTAFANPIRAQTCGRFVQRIPGTQSLALNPSGDERMFQTLESLHASAIAAANDAEKLIHGAMEEDTGAGDTTFTSDQITYEWDGAEEMNVIDVLQGDWPVTIQVQ